MSSAEPVFRPPLWAADYDKHHPDHSLEWKQVVQTTGGPDGVARYHSSLSIPQIETMEMETVSDDLGLGTEIVAKRKHNRRVYWRHMGRIIGASNGKETEYIYVEYAQSGNVHGRPITKAELRKEKGVKL